MGYIYEEMDIAKEKTQMDLVRGNNNNFLFYLAPTPFGESLIKCIGHCMMRAITLIPSYTMMLSLNLIMG